MQHLYERIDRDPRFHALARRRSLLGWGLSAAVLIAYYAFVLAIAFVPGLLATPLGPDTVLTVGIIAGLAVIVLSVGLTGIYVWRANRTFDGLNAAIVGDATRDAEGEHAA